MSESFVVLDGPALRGLLDGAAAADTTVALTTPGGPTLQVPPHSWDLRPDGFSFIGYGDDDLVLTGAHDPGVLEPGGLVVSAWMGTGERAWVIEPVLGGPVHRFGELDGGYRVGGPDGVGDGEAAEGSPASDDGLVPEAPASDGSPEQQSLVTGPGPNVDVLMLYTAAARNQHGSANAVRAFLGNQVDRGTLANAESGVPGRFNLVQILETGTVEHAGQLSNDLRDLKESGEGFADEAHGWRPQVGADVVVFAGLGYGSTIQPDLSRGACGMAFLMNQVSTAFESSAFAVVDVDPGCRSIVAHEVGHVAALRHDWANSDGAGSPYTFNHGFVSALGNFHTIMAYPAPCPVGCNELVRWSNFAGTHNGQATGVAPGNANPAHNAGALVDTLATVAAFRTANQPFGVLEVASRGPGGIRVTGWAIDPDTSAPIDVHVYVGGAGTSLGAANGTRGDISDRYPAFGANHGFDATVAVTTAGQFSVCAYAINAPGTPGGNPVLGCQTVTVAFNPFGSFDVAARSPGGIRVAGWAIDPDTASAIDVHVYVGAAGTSLGAANRVRSDIGAAYPSYGSNHGFDSVIPAAAGWQDVCAYALNAPGTQGGNLLLGCRTVWVTVDPFGNVDLIQRTGLVNVRVIGWALDPDTGAAISVRILGGVISPTTVTANVSRSDVGAAYPGYGTAHGFDSTIVVGNASKNICVWAVNYSGTPGVDKLLRCQTV